MKSEYVRLSPSEKGYGQKNLLQSQLEILDSVAHMREYKQLRGEELLLKVALKNKIESTLESLRKLSKLLPKTQYKPFVFEKPVVKKKTKEKLSLNEEMERIKSKLAKLQREM